MVNERLITEREACVNIHVGHRPQRASGGVRIYVGAEVVCAGALGATMRSDGNDCQETQRARGYGRDHLKKPHVLEACAAVRH